MRKSSIVAAGDRSTRIEQDAQERILANLAAALDRTLPVPLGVQLRGLIEFGIGLGELQPGQRLPSVRELAERAGIAPMTVAGVYRELRRSGLIEAKPGAGTYVSDGHSRDGLRSTAMRKIQRRIDALFNEAEELGLSPTVVASLVNARAARGRSQPRPVHIVIVGHFLDTTQQYADRIREHLGPADSIAVTTLSALQAGEPLPQPCDLCVTFPHRRSDVESLVPPGTPMANLSFIPAEETRAKLAVIDPMARIGIVSIFPEFMALMKPGVLRFTPHVSDVEVRLITEPDLKDFLKTLDVLVYASGAEPILRDFPEGRQAIEFRYDPDPHAVRQVLLPEIERLRSASPAKEEASE
ncbi:GntR family transcriptional regulator [Microvirga thermotolerans]|uniref:GntR family transcriptional regulator n=1 Tax=Microvirga thermotolerans TaxID=2651334 RepID=A0A5P9JVE2_9HYPH|nr:GntR family transcriptional regulator [Microvirga thermotolerans]QFU15135.1 GntR family transcriptional regulator [Microvirga thermotolerans]